MSDKIIQVAIIEDDSEIRQTLALIIKGTPGFYCQNTFADAESAIDQIPNLVLDVVLADIDLPGVSGIEAVKKLKVQKPEIDFLMLTVQQDDESVFRSICAGASGYLIKDTPPSELLKSIQEVHNGGAPMSTNIARKVIQSFHKWQPSPLSDRETEILKLLSNGMNYRSIAAQLFLSPHTVKTHIKNIYGKLHVNSRAAAVKKAIEDGLI